jgi:hypothetical protein
MELLRTIRSISIADYPPECHEKIAELKGKYGEIPEDLEYSCMKD